MSQRFLIASVGSLGDVVPYLNIAKQLQGMGHEVRVFSNDEFRERVERAGIAFESARLGLASQVTASNPNLWHPVKGMGVLWRGLLVPSIATLFRAIQDLPAGCGQWHVVAGPHMLGARLAQEHLNVRLTSVYTAPNMLRTCIAPTTIANSFWPRMTPRWMLATLWATVDHYKLQPMARESLRLVCAELGISPPPPTVSLFGQWVHSTERGITLYPEWFSQVPADQSAHIIAGDFPLTEGSFAKPELPETVQRFLQSGTAPIVVMMGSSMQHAAHLYARWQEAILAADQRVILISANEAQMPSSNHPNVLKLAYVPFDALLQHTSALVHHGGIGSCSHALAAGIPQVIQPHSHDQFENARCVQALGAGLRLARDANATDMLATLRRTLEPDRQQAACRLKVKVSPQGAARVAQLILR